MYKCPVCNEVLNQIDKSYKCLNGHCFDVNKKGFVNLLLANQSHSENPGDSKEMIDANVIAAVPCPAVKAERQSGFLVKPLDIGLRHLFQGKLFYHLSCLFFCFLLIKSIVSPSLVYHFYFLF